MNEHARRRDRSLDARTRGTDAKLAADKLSQAAGAIRSLEADLETAFELVYEARQAMADAGLEGWVCMGPEASAAFRVWLDGLPMDKRLDVMPVDIPAVLR